MLDFGRSDDPHVQAQLDRLSGLSIQRGRLELDAIRELMARLGNPHRRLPPVFHVSGTNGKGSTCAFLRAMLEAQGLRVHVTISPHLVRYNERIRLAGELISDEALAPLLAEVLDASEGLSPSFFEVTIAASFLAFSRVPADACVVEVGLGGRLDATNVLEPDAIAACGIAALGIDHEKFLLAPDDGVPDDPMARIAFEKAGIAKHGVPLVTMGKRYPQQCRAAIAQISRSVGAPMVELPMDAEEELSGIALPLQGQHQKQNAALAIAMLRSQSTFAIGKDAIRHGIASVRWPARMQRLSVGPLVGTKQVWLDGGHNPNAGAMLGAFFAGQRIHLIIGMLDAKDPAALTKPLSGSLASITAVPVPGHDAHGPEAFVGAKAEPDVPSAIATLPQDGLPVLIAGSLYLAGEVLRLNDEIPD